ncbi:MAG: hypothetical protein FJX95_02415 [Bacteroidetes bacterium]|nr:hypothetical protein [Bacteroidota bacterium]
MKKLLYAVLLFLPSLLQAQNAPQGVLRGNFQFLAQQYSADSLINATVPASKASINGFGNFLYTHGKVTAGWRIETYQNAIQGYSAQNRYKGTGIGNRYITYADSTLEITIGNFYEQFGNGLTLRTYWEPNLGIDNALDGTRVIFRPVSGVTLKGIWGKQRLDFDNQIIHADGTIRGFDSEIWINELVKKWGDAKTRVMVGGNFISRYQAGGNRFVDTLVFVIPDNVAMYSGRVQIQRGNWMMMGEYAEKINDPSADNGYIYRNGKGIFLNSSYSKKGFGVNVMAKSIDNLSFRGDRNLKLFDVPVNFTPAITKQHTYNLAATLYPYATPLTGEASFMLELYYSLPKGSKLGGKYGTQISASYAAANCLDTAQYNGVNALTEGYKVNSLGFGKTKYVRDFNFDIKRKITKEFNVGYTFYYMEFNTLATPVTNDFKGMVYANISVLDMGYKLSKKDYIRIELQELHTKQDKGDWQTVVMEYTHSPHWNIGIVNQYNKGNPIEERKINYLFGTIGYINGPHRISLGYGKRREGVFCIGGVCRAVPATNGFEISITSSF